MRKVFCVMALVFGAGCISAQAEDAGQQKIAPKRVVVDTNFDGKQDRTEIYGEKGQIQRVESDANYDGVTDEWVYYKDGKPVKSDKDTNGDGKPDVWVEY